MKYNLSFKEQEFQEHCFETQDHYRKASQMRVTIESLKVSNGEVALYDYDMLNSDTAPKDWENIEMLDSSRNIIWRVHGMQDHKYWNANRDTFVTINMINGKLTGVTFAGNAFLIDLETGHATFKAFVK